MQFIYYDELVSIWEMNRKGSKTILIGKDEYVKYAIKHMHVKNSIKNKKLISDYYNIWKNKH